MRRCLLIIAIVSFAILISGCYDTNSEEHFVRTYTHTSSNNVTINIFKYPEDKLNVIESTTGNITVNISFYLIPENAKGNQFYVRDYVRFAGDDKNISVNISLKSNINNWDRGGANVQTEIYLPKNTSYTINNLGTDIFPDDNESKFF